MIFKKLVKIFIQTLITTTAVMGLVIWLLGFLPDYATFDEVFDKSSKLDSKVYASGFFDSQWQFWRGVFADDFGVSRSTRDQSVGDFLRQDGKVSFFLFLGSLVFTIFSAALLGLICAYYQGRFFDRVVGLLGLLMTSLPSFLLIPLLIYFFALKWSLFPPGLWEGPRSLVLPIIALSLRPIFFLARLFQEQLMASSRAPFVTAARAKGLGVMTLWSHHIIPNSLNGFVVASGNLFGQLVTGSFLVELLFALPGLGALMVKSLAQRDYPIFLGVVLLFTLVLQLGHRLSELILSSVVKAELVDQDWVA